MKYRKSAVFVLLFLLFFLLLLLLFLCVSGGENNQVLDARNGVVRILVVGTDGTYSYYSSGTGFGVGTAGEDADTFVTNWHVVTSNGSFDYHNARIYILLDDETTARYRWYPVPYGENPQDYGDEFIEQDGTYFVKVFEGISMGSAVECEVLYAENQYPDVAVLRTKEPVANVEALPLRRVSQKMVGEEIRAIGYPVTADLSSTVYSSDNVQTEKMKASVKAVSVAYGNISRCLPMEIFGDTECIEHGAHINHGNSGGPLVLEDGSVIGINTYGYGENAMEYSVSIYIDYAMDIMDNLGIDYDVAGDGKDFSDVLPFAVAGILVIILVPVILVAAQKQNGKKQPAPAALNAHPAAANINPAIPNVNPALSETQDFRLQGIKGIFAGKRFAIVKDVCIGRDAGQCGLVYPQEAKSISRLHCMIRIGSSGLTITDLGSTVGTYVNGKKLIPNQPALLSVGDHIFLAGANEEFQITKKGGVV